MLIIPFEVRDDAERGPIIVVMILEKENLDRMREADPFDVHFSAYRGQMNVNRQIRELDFVIAYEEDTAKIIAFKQKNDLAGLIAWLERGRKIIPGDVTPPVPYRLN